MGKDGYSLPRLLPVALTPPRHQEQIITTEEFQRKHRCWCCMDTGIIPAYVLNLLAIVQSYSHDVPILCRRLTCDAIMGDPGSDGSTRTKMPLNYMDQRLEPEVCDWIHRAHLEYVKAQAALQQTQAAPISMEDIANLVSSRDMNQRIQGTPEPPELNDLARIDQASKAAMRELDRQQAAAELAADLIPDTPSSAIAAIDADIAANPEYQIEEGEDIPF